MWNIVERTRISILNTGGNKKENSAFQSELADLITSKEPIDSWALFPNTVYHKPNVKGIILGKTNQACSSHICLAFFSVVLFILKPGSKSRPGEIIRSRCNEAGGNINWIKNHSGRQFVLEVLSCLSHEWAEFSWKLVEISNPNLCNFLKHLSMCFCRLFLDSEGLPFLHAGSWWWAEVGYAFPAG